LSSENPIGIPFIELPEVESTNNYAMGLAHAAMAQHGTAVFTCRQTKGKGQRTKSWESEPGQNLALSVIIEPKRLALDESFLLSMAIAVAAKNLLLELSNADVKIKWPNDLYINDRKAGGILIENKVSGTSWKYAICGIGINVNQTEFGDLQQKAISLKQVSGKEFHPTEVARQLCAYVDLQYNQLQRDKTPVIAEYRDSLYKIGERVRLKKNNRSFEALVKGVNTQGQLLIEHGVEETYDVGQVEWLL
jgi:BirA family transcriptional regulator, biotin operon repressor / biotin---[acetyl-CoA-carboxylase] ligase